MKILIIALTIVVTSSGWTETLPDLQTLKQFAAEAKINADQAEREYNRLLTGTLPEQTAALSDLKRLKAFRIIAFALPKMNDRGKGEAIKALAATTESDPLVVKVLTDELESQNFIIPNGEENVAAHEMTKQRLITILSRLTAIPIQDTLRQSQSDVRVFIEKIRTAKNSRP
jgi:hypothetical protein